LVDGEQIGVEDCVNTERSIDAIFFDVNAASMPTVFKLLVIVLAFVSFVVIEMRFNLSIMCTLRQVCIHDEFDKEEKTEPN